MTGLTSVQFFTKDLQSHSNFKHYRYFQIRNLQNGGNKEIDLLQAIIKY